MTNYKYPIQFEFQKSQKTFKLTMQKLYKEMSTTERSALIKQKHEQGCSITCYCQSKKPVPMQVSTNQGTYHLKNYPNNGHLHRRDCYWFSPPSEKHEFWDTEKGVIRLPFSAENLTYQKQEDSLSTKGKRNTSYRPTFQQFSKQLFIQTQTHFLNTALKKEESIIPSFEQFHFYLNLKLKQYELNEGILLSELHLETPTFSMIQHRQKDLATKHLLNWDQAQFFICHKLEQIDTFEWKNKTYTVLTLLSAKNKKPYQVAYSGNLCQSLRNQFSRSITELLKQSQLWAVGWLPIQQKQVPTFNGKKLPLLSKESHMICLSTNGCFVQNSYELNLFNQFAKANQPLRGCFYGEKLSPIKGDVFPTALWVIQGINQKRQYKSICLFTSKKESLEKEKKLEQLKKEEHLIWTWDLSETKEIPRLPFKTN